MVAMIGSCFAPFTFLLGLALGLLAISVHRAAYGLCGRCEKHRKPACACPGGDPSEPLVKRPDWTHRRRK